MDICIDEIDWDKPIIWFNNASGRYFKCSFISDDCFDETRNERKEEFHYCVFVETKVGGGIIRYVDKKGYFDKDRRFCFNKAETQVIVEEKLEPLGPVSDAVNGLGVM